AGAPGSRYERAGATASPRPRAGAHLPRGDSEGSLGRGRARRGVAAETDGVASLPGDGSGSVRQRTATDLSPVGKRYGQFAQVGRRACARNGRRAAGVSAARPEARGGPDATTDAP